MKTTDIAGLMEKHRYREYLNRLDAREVLARYGAENVREAPGSDGTTEVVRDGGLIDVVESGHDVFHQGVWSFGPCTRMVRRALCEMDKAR